MPGSAGQDQSLPFDPIAQTIVEVFAKMRRRGHGAADFALARRAYDLTLQLNSCLYRSSGRSLVEHLMGTTGVVIDVGASGKLVAASLLHDVYLHGDFGGMRQRLQPAHRDLVRRAVGDDVEEIVACYRRMDWMPRDFTELARHPGDLDPLHRQAVLIRLCDQIDLYATGEARYTSNAEQRRRFASTHGPTLVTLANALGHPDLARRLDVAFAETSHPAPASLCEPRWSDRLLLPASYRQRASVALYRRTRAALWRWTGH